MYTPGMLQRFGEDVKLTRSVDGEDFLQAIQNIKYERVGKLWDFQICVGAAVKDALKGTKVEHLAGELNQRVKEFYTEEERMLETEALEQPHKSKVWRLILKARLKLMEWDDNEKKR